MLTQLKPGNTIYVLEQQEDLKLSTGKVVNVMPSYTGNVDMEVKVNDQTYKFQQVPFNQSVVKNDFVIIGETKDQILNEVKKIKEDSDKILDNISYYKSRSKQCEEILRQNNPTYDKELKRDEEINQLKDQMSAMMGSLANIEKLLNKQSNDDNSRR